MPYHHIKSALSKYTLPALIAAAGVVSTATFSDSANARSFSWGTISSNSSTNSTSSTISASIGSSGSTQTNSTLSPTVSPDDLFTPGIKHTFEERRLDWLARDGKKPNGEYDQTVKVLAWLENGTHKNEIPDIVRERLNVDLQSGTYHMLFIAWLYFGYLDQLNAIDPSLKGEIEEKLKMYVNSDYFVSARHWGNSVQPNYAPVALLFTQDQNLNATMKFREDRERNRSYTSPYSGKHYQEEEYYNTYEMTRDWMLHGFDTWTTEGSDEMDGHYSNIMQVAGLLVHDFANRPGIAFPTDGAVLKKRAKMFLDFLRLEHGMTFSARAFGGGMGRNYQADTVNGELHNNLEAINGNYTGLHYGYVDGYDYVSSYRPPIVIDDLVNLSDESVDYWHMHLENNKSSGSDGKFYLG